MSDSQKAALTPLLSFHDIKKGFFGVPVLKNIHLTLHAGEVLALIGENGAGKSTLMNVLGGVLQADSGDIMLNGQSYRCSGPQDALAQGISFIHQELNLFPNLTVVENIFINHFPRIKGIPLINRREINRRAKEVLMKVSLDVAPEEPLENLSPGERQLVEIAKALAAHSKIIILDEPTTSLTTREIKRLMALMNQLRDEGVAMIFISHALEDVKKIADQIAVLRDGEVIVQSPANQLSIDDMISLMVGRQLDAIYPPKEINVSNKVVLELSGITESKIVKNIDLKLHQGEVLGIFGLMGAGRTELLRIVFGLDKFSYGQIKVLGKVITHPKPARSIKHGLAFVTESRRDDGLLMSLSVMDNLVLVRLMDFVQWGFLKFAQMNQKMLALIQSALIKTTHPQTQSVRSLSGGNQQKVIIGKWLAGHPKVFIMDEPTRGIDVGAKYEVYTQIQNLAHEGAGVLVASSELEELIGICSRIVVMAQGEMMGEFKVDEFDRVKILKAAFGGVK